MTWEKEAPAVAAARGDRGLGKPAKRLNDSTFNRPGATAIDRLTLPEADRRALERSMRQMVEQAFRFATLSEMLRSYTRECAAAHEAGHAVVMAAEGIAPRLATIRRVRSAPPGVPMWTGKTCEGSDWVLRPEMGAEAYLSRARITIAGLLGEADAGLAVPGSSADELAVAQSIAGGAAQLLGRDPRGLFLTEVLAPTVALIRRHRAAHRRVSRALEKRRKLDGPTLARMLVEVRP